MKRKKERTAFLDKLKLALLRKIEEKLDEEASAQQKLKFGWFLNDYISVVYVYIKNKKHLTHIGGEKIFSTTPTFALRIATWCGGF